MSGDASIKVRVTLSGDTVKGSVEEINRDVSKIGQTAQASAGQAASALNYLGETSDQAAARIRNVVQSSLAEVDAMFASTTATQAAAAAKVNLAQVNAELAAAERAEQLARAESIAKLEAYGAAERALAELRANTRAALESQATTLDQVAQKQSLYQKALQAEVITQEEYNAATKTLSKTKADLIKAEQGELDTALKLVDRYGGAKAALEQLAVAEGQVVAARAKGLISAEQEAVALAGIAAERAEMENAANAAAKLTLNTSLTRREFTLLAKDIATGDFSRASREMGTLSASTGIARLAFTGLGAVITLGITVVSGLVAAVIAGYREMDHFAKATIATGNSAGQSAGRLADLANEMSHATGEFSKSHEAVLLLAQDGRISGETFAAASRGIVAMSVVTGQAVDKVVDEFGKLSRDPLKGVVELNDKYHVLTSSIYDQIKALQEQGKAHEATDLAVRTLADTMENRRQQMVDTAGAVERAWRAISSAVADAIQQVKDFGRTDDQAQFQRALNRQNAILAVQAARANPFSASAAQTSVAATLAAPDLLVKTDAQLQQAFLDNQKLLNSINDRIRLQKKADDDAAGQHALNDAEVKANQTLDQTLERLDKKIAKQKAINDLNTQFAALQPGNPRLAGVAAIPGAALGTGAPAFTGGLYTKALDDINEKYSDHGKAAHQAEAADRAFQEALNDVTKATNAAAAAQDPLKKAEADHDAALIRLVGDYQKAVDAAQKDAKLKAQLPAFQLAVVRAILAENEALEKNRAAIERKQDVVANTIKQLDDEIAAHGQSRAAIEAERVVREAENRAIAAKDPLSKTEIENLTKEVTAREAVKEALDYTDKLKENNAQLLAEGKAYGALTPLQRAELEIEKLMPDLLKQETAARQAKIDSMRQEAALQQTLQAGQSLSNELSNIFTQTAQGIGNGTDAWQAFGKAAQGSLAGISKDVSNLLIGMRGLSKGTEQYDKALKGLKDDATAALPALGQLLGTVVGGGGNGAQLGSAVGGLIGGAIGAYFGGAVGYAIGSAIGSFAGGIIGGQGDGNGTPAVYASSRPGSTSRDHRPATTTPLGIIAIDTDNLADDAYKTFAASVKNFDIQLAKLFDPEQLAAVEANLAGFSGKFSDINALLQARFDVVLNALGSTIKDFVNGFAADLQGRVQALADVLNVQKVVDSGTSFVDNIGDALKLVNEFGQAGERVVETFNRIAVASAAWTTAMGLMGYQMQGTAVDIAEFAAKIAAAGSTTQESTTLWDSYFKHFYTTQELNAEKVKELQTKVTDTFAKIGEDPTESLAKFREDFEAALPTLTPEQIIDWLRAGAALGAFDDAVKEAGGDATAATKTVQDYADALAAQKQAYDDSLQGAADYLSTVDALQNELYGAADGTTSFRTAIANVRLWEAQTVDTLNQAARAAGEQGAAESDLALVHQVAAARIAAAMQKLLSETQTLIAQLNTPDLTGGAVQDNTQQQIASINSVGAAADDMYQRQKQAIQSIQDYLDSQLLGDTSALTPQQRIAEAFTQLQKAQQAALGGDATAAAKLPQLADAYLRLVQQGQASGDDYNSQVAIVRALLQAVVDHGVTASPGGTGGGGISDAGLAQHDKQVAEQMAEQRKQLALQLAEHLRDLSAAINKPVTDLIVTMGYSMKKLAEDLGIDLNNITGASVVSLGQLASALGISLGTLTTDLGKNLTDLGGGIKELETNLGIDMNNLTGSQVTALSTLAASLGLSLNDLVTSTGNHLTDLASGIKDLEGQMGIDFNNLTGSQFTALTGLANQLGLSLSDLVSATGNNLTDLAGGVKALTDSLGIDLNNLTGSTVQQLGDLASTLGIKISDLAGSVGLDLGDLADKQSLLNQALAGTINDLPDSTRDQLQPLLEAISTATTQADANQAIKNLEDAVSALPSDQSNKLAPYFADIFPKQASSDLDFLKNINDYAATTSSAITDVRNTIQDMYNYGVAITNQSLDVVITNWQDAKGGSGGSYAVGSSYIPSDMTAQIHEGEAVIDAQSNAILQKYGIKVSGTSSDSIVAEVRALREEVQNLRRDNTRYSAEQVQIMKTEGVANRAHRSQANDKLVRDLGPRGRSNN